MCSITQELASLQKVYKKILWIDLMVFSLTFIVLVVEILKAVEILEGSPKTLWGAIIFIVIILLLFIAFFLIYKSKKNRDVFQTERIRCFTQFALSRLSKMALWPTRKGSLFM